MKKIDLPNSLPKRRATYMKKNQLGIMKLSLMEAIYHAGFIFINYKLKLFLQLRK
jgi:hypothetical protein